jgi:hypothetical protein
MLRYSLVLVAGLLATSSARAAAWADGLFDELNKDFGSVPQGPTLVHNFRVLNNTRGPITISNVRVSCGCVHAVALKNFLQPGEETTVVANMDTTRFLGMKTVTIYVQLTQPGFDEVRLWVRANARSDFTVAPNVLALGVVKRTTTPSGKVSITFYGHTDARIVEARGESNYVRPTFREVRRGEVDVSYEVTAALRSDTPVGKWYTDVWLKTNIPSLPQVRVPLTVDVASALSVVPEQVALGAVRMGGEVERRVIVRGVKPFKITRLAGVDSNLTVKGNTTAAREIHVLTVRYKPAAIGELLKQVRVLTDLPGDDAEIDFRVSGIVVP